MPLDFPSAPTQGEQWTGQNGVNYIWDGVKWVAAGVPGGSGAWLPLSGGTMTGPLLGIRTDSATTTTSGPLNQVVWPVGNAEPPTTTYPQGRGQAQVIVQGATALDSNWGETTAVFGNYVNTGSTNGQKVTVFIGAVQGPNAGAAWTLNTEIVRNAIPAGNIPGGPGGIGSGSPGTPGACQGTATIGYELDYVNYDQNCAPAVGPFTVGMYVSNASTHTSLAAIYLDCKDESSGVNPAWSSGIMFEGTMLVANNTIYDGTNAPYSYQSQGTRTGGTFYSNDTAPYAFIAGGTHSTADFYSSDNAPTALLVHGSHTHVVDTTSGTISGLAWNGAFSATSIDNTPIGSTTPAAGTFVGITNGSNAAAGMVGEFISATSGAISLTSGVQTNITSIALTAGDWDVAGYITFSPAATTATQQIAGSSSTTSATIGTANFNIQAPAGAALAQSLPIPTVRYNVTAATTVYLIADMQFSGGTATAAGTIRARRMR